MRVTTVHRSSKSPIMARELIAVPTIAGRVTITASITARITAVDVERPER